MNQIEELLKRVLTSLLVDMVISGARAVSYTHLDVYKRQEQYWTN